MPKSAHVTRNAKGGWKATKGGRTVSNHRTQKAAMNAARKTLKRAGGGELVTHGVDGRIRQKNTVTPARDPYPPAG